MAFESDCEPYPRPPLHLHRARSSNKVKSTRNVAYEHAIPCTSLNVEQPANELLGCGAVWPFVHARQSPQLTQRAEPANPVANVETGAPRLKVKRIPPLNTPASRQEVHLNGHASPLRQRALHHKLGRKEDPILSTVEVIPEIATRRPETRVGFVLYRHPMTPVASPCKPIPSSPLDSTDFTGSANLSPAPPPLHPSTPDLPPSLAPAGPEALLEPDSPAPPMPGKPVSPNSARPPARITGLAQKLAALAPQLPGLQPHSTAAAARAPAPPADSDSIGSWASRKKVYPVRPAPAPAPPALPMWTASRGKPPARSTPSAPSPIRGAQQPLERTASTKVHRVPLLGHMEDAGRRLDAGQTAPGKGDGKAAERVEAALEEAWRHMFRRKWRREQLWRVARALEAPQRRGARELDATAAGGEYEDDAWEQALDQMQAVQPVWSPQDDTDSILSAFSPDRPADPSGRAAQDEDPLAMLLAADAGADEAGDAQGLDPPHLDALRQVAAVASKVAILQQHQATIQQRVEDEWARLGGTGQGSAAWRVPAANGFRGSTPGLKPASAHAIAA